MYFNRDYLFDILDFAILNGGDERAFADLRKRSSEGDENRTTYEIIDRGLQLAVKETGDDHIGLHLGEHAVLKATSNVDQIMKWSMNVEEAFENAVQYSLLISDSMQCRLNKGVDEFGVSFHCNPDWELRSELAKRHNLDSALVSALNAFPKLTGNRFYPERVLLPYKRPRKFNEYYRVFNCAVTFNRPYAEIIFSNRLLNAHVNSADSGLLLKAKQSAEKAIQELVGSGEFLTEVRRVILGNMKGTRFPMLRELSALMNMTERTLQRKLKAKGSSFKDILLDIKMKLASKYLGEEGMSVEETAYLIGYSEASAFVRAFKKHFGQSPKRFRFH